MKKLTAIMLGLLMVLSFGLAACGDDDNGSKTATAYGLGYNSSQYVRVTLTADTDKAVTEVNIDEFLGINDLGRLQNSASTDIVESGDKLGTGNGSYAARIRIGDKTFLRNESNEAYTNSDGSAITIDSTFMEWYIGRMEAGDYSILKGSSGTEAYTEITFTKYRTVDTTVTKQQWANKTLNGYTMGGNTQSFAENIEKIEAAILEYGMVNYDADENNDHKISGGETGATLAQFNVYMAVVVSAFNLAT